MELEIDGLVIEIKKKNIKNMYLRISPEDGKIKVSAPNRISDKRIEEFIVSRQAWIEENYKKMQEKQEKQSSQYGEGDKVSLWGKGYILHYKENGWKKGIVQGVNEIDLYGCSGLKQEEVEAIFLKWYREKLKRAVPLYIKKWEASMNVHVKEWRTKKMKTRWGTCNVVDHRIWINVELAKYPPYCLEYIVIHEMAHLLERSHNKRFQKIMDQFCPQWRQIRAELNGS